MAVIFVCFYLVFGFVKKHLGSF